MKTKSLSSFLVTANCAVLILAFCQTGLAEPAGQSISALLEKGIYSEQSKGDLDAAMKLYEQILAEAKGNQALAAQAQYRLGVCYYKKKQYTQASAAFEKLIADYPEQKELVAQANQYLSGATGLLPVPWKENEELLLDIKFSTGIKIGMVSYSVRADELEGRKVWRISSRTSAGVQSFSRVVVEADSFKPLQSRWKHTLIGDVETTYGPNKAKLKSAGKEEIKTLDLEGVVYDNEEAVQLMRRLPLEAGYKTSLAFLSGLGGSIVPVKLEVTGPEAVEVPAGTFNCYKVELNIRQTFWYSADADRYLVKFEGGGAIAELTQIRHPKAGETAHYEDSKFHFRLSGPAGWHFDSSEVAAEKGQTSVMILDPEAAATCFVRVQKLDQLKPESRASVRAWAEQLIAENTESHEAKVRANSWKERQISGRPATTVTVDYVERKEKKIAYLCCGLGETTATYFLLLVNEKDFDALKPSVDSIVDSYQAK